MNRLERIIPLVLLLTVAACNGSTESGTVEAVDTTPQLKANAEPLEITWEQLMPEGEEARLEELYTDYYAELERQFQEDLVSGGAEGESPDIATQAQDIASIIAEGSANDTMEQVGTFNVVHELNGKRIRLPGYVVPFDFSSKSTYREFLLVPYFGACLHTPPPPPNQIVFVKAEEAARIESIYDPVWVEGVLTTGQFNSDLADTAYELVLDKVEAYDY